MIFCPCSNRHNLHWFTLSDQLSRLHMILKPFMLRRIKKDVENELSDKVTQSYSISDRIMVCVFMPKVYVCDVYFIYFFKPLSQIEILTYCQLTSRQRLLYQALKNKISIEDLLQSSMGTAQQSHSTTSSLMNLVMQFRKVRLGLSARCSSPKN